MAKASLTISIGGEYNNKAIARAKEDLRNFQLEAARSSGGIASSIVSAGDKLVATGKKVTSFGNDVSKFGKDLTIATAPIAALGGIAIKSFTDVEKGTHALIAATGATGKAADDLEKAYRNAAVNVVGSFEDIGSAAGELNTRLGFMGDELTKNTEQVAKYAKVTGVDMTQAVQDVASLMNNAKIEAGDFSKVLDWLTVAGQASGISVSSLANSVNDNAASLKEMGFSTEASIALLANLEKEGANTTSILSAMKKGVANWTKEGKNADQEFAKFVAGVKDGSTDMAYAIEVFGSKAGTAMFDAAQKGQLDFIDMYETIIDKSNGALDEVYENTLTAQERLEVATKKIQNRMADTGAIIMDKLIPVVEKACDVVDDLVTWFDNLDDGTKDVVVQLGLVAVAAGPLLMVGGKMVSVLGQVITGVGKGVQSFGLLVNKFTAASKSVTGVTSSLSGLKIGLAGLGIGVVIALIGQIIAKCQEWAEWNRKVTQATEGLKNATNSLKAGYSSYAGSVQEVTYSLKDLKEHTEQVITSQAELADSLTNEFKQVGVNAAMVDTYSQQISELANRYDESGNAIQLTTEEQIKLKAAVEGYNQATGEQIQITDLATGKLSESTDAILKNADAYRKQAQEAAAMSALQKLYEQKIEAEMLATEADRAYNEELARGVEAYGNNQFAAEAHAQTLAKLKAECDLANESVQAADDAIENMTGLLIESSDQVANLSKALEDNEVSLSDFGQLTNEQLTALADNYKGKLGDVVKTCADMGIEIPTTLANAIKSNSSAPEREQDLMLQYMALSLTNNNIDEASKLLGHDIDDGLRQGIEGGADLPTAAAKVMSEQTINAAKDALDSHSPSQVFYGIGGDVTSGLANGINDTASTATDASTQMATACVDAVSGLPGDMQTIGSDSGSGLSSGLGAWISGVGTSSDSLYGSAMGGISGTPSGFAVVASQAASQYASTIGGSSARKEGEALGKTAKDGVGSVSAESAGSNFVSSFSRGMGSVSIWDAAWNIGNKALSAIKSALGIHSPSKEGKYVGEMLTKGVALGGEAEADNLYSQMYEMGLNSISALDDGLNAAAVSMPSITSGMPWISGNKYGDISYPETPTQREIAQNKIEINITINGDKINSNATPQVNNAVSELISALELYTDMG